MWIAAITSWDFDAIKLKIASSTVFAWELRTAACSYLNRELASNLNPE